MATRIANPKYCQAARVRALQDAYRKAEAASPRDNAPTAGQIRNLGLINKDDVSKEVINSTAS